VAQSEPQPSAGAAETLTFAALGDIPYDEDEFPLLRRQLAELEPELPFIFHVGDIKRSTVPFREDAYGRVADELKRSKVPVFITLGDNEYNDAADPELALSYWRKYFGDLHNHWQHGLDVQYQPNRRENVAFVHRGVLFVMINLVGSKIHDRKEWADRIRDDADWIEAAFARHGEQVRAAVVIGHANPGPGAKPAFGPVNEALVAAATKFAKPVLYIHGDGHRWTEKNSFEGAPNILRIQVDQGGIAPPVRITVAAAGAAKPFVFDRRLTDEYAARRIKYDAARKTPRAASPTPTPVGK
jgi:hypothetical protein